MQRFQYSQRQNVRHEVDIETTSPGSSIPDASFVPAERYSDVVEVFVTGNDPKVGLRSFPNFYTNILDATDATICMSLSESSVTMVYS